MGFCRLFTLSHLYVLCLKNIVPGIFPESPCTF
jgi:hypothetical protein